MKFTNIRDLKYITANNSMIDLLATCEEYGEIPMTLNLVDTEDIHTFVKPDGTEIPLEEYCKTLEIAPFDTEAYNKQKEQDRINAINSKVNQIIESKYPLYKQNNIIRLATPYTQQDLTDMSLWIDSKRDIFHNAVEQGLQPDEVIWGE